MQQELQREAFKQWGSNVKYFEDPNGTHWPAQSAPADILSFLFPNLGQVFTDKPDAAWKKNGSFEAFDQYEITR